MHLHEDQTSTVTNRNFRIIKFTDINQKDCSLQESSAILDYDDSLQKPGSSSVWLGRDEARMHLDRGSVRALIAKLHWWLKTGNLE